MMTVLVLAGCSTMDTEDAVPKAVSPSPSSSPSQPSMPPPQASREAAMRTDLDAAIVDMPGQVGVAVAAVGSDTVTTFGSWSDGPAWSTIKVPLVLASMSRPGTFILDAAESAITISDNAAAEEVWSSLGDDERAAAEVTRVLASGGDEVTTVPSFRSRSDYSIFGQTRWTLGRQAVFAAHLPCLAEGERILDLMGSVSPEQQWGLGRLDGTEFKGGWGPSEGAGKYLVRQFGLLDESVAVSMAVEPDSGSFEDGTAMLDALAAVIGSHRADLPVGVCPSTISGDSAYGDRTTR